VVWRATPAGKGGGGRGGGNFLGWGVGGGGGGGDDKRRNLEPETALLPVDDILGPEGAWEEMAVPEAGDPTGAGGGRGGKGGGKVTGKQSSQSSQSLRRRNLGVEAAGKAAATGGGGKFKLMPVVTSALAGVGAAAAYLAYRSLLSPVAPRHQHQHHNDHSADVSSSSSSASSSSSETAGGAAAELLKPIPQQQYQHQQQQHQQQLYNVPAIPEQIMGHFRMDEAPRHTLVKVDAEGSVSLRRAAAESYLRMQRDAAAGGINLIPVSGFRSIEYQEKLFFTLKAERKQTAMDRALVSAPPGHSEHHTGYAIDISCPSIGDDLLTEFEDTAAFRWLKEHAAEYHFEMSFGKDNPMGVSYEPWHYRFVGDRHSLSTFARTVEVTKAAAQAAAR
jgi:D-alanyl-D-alanine carboxypeptidase